MLLPLMETRLQLNWYWMLARRFTPVSRQGRQLSTLQHVSDAPTMSHVCFGVGPRFSKKMRTPVFQFTMRHWEDLQSAQRFCLSGREPIMQLRNVLD